MGFTRTLIFFFLLFVISMQIPNGLGAFFGAMQLILYGCYYRSTNWDDEFEHRSELQLPTTKTTENGPNESI